MKFENICRSLLNDYDPSYAVRPFNPILFVNWLRSRPDHRYHDWFFDENEEIIVQIFYENRSICLFSEFITSTTYNRYLNDTGALN